MLSEKTKENKVNIIMDIARVKRGKYKQFKLKWTPVLQLTVHTPDFLHTMSLIVDYAADAGLTDGEVACLISEIID